MDVRCAGATGRPRRPEGQHRSWLRCGPDDLGSRRDVHRRCVRARAQASTDALPRPDASRLSSLDVRAGPRGICQRPVRPISFRTSSVMSPSSGSAAPGTPGQAPSSSPDFTDLIDLAGTALGGAVIAANDEFFAPKEALLKPGPPEWREGAYTERGKWMDGWETRRRRSAGHDWAIIRLGAAGIVRGVVIDTSYFTGNYPERASIDATTVEGVPSSGWLSGDEVRWTPLLAEVPLLGNSVNEFRVEDERKVTHLRLNIFPDGVVAP